jgi:GMP synthase (glutamine-hydrolysing)
MTSQATILVIKTGTTEPTVVATHGDYDDWFQAHFRIKGVRSTLCRAFLGEALPDPRGFDGVLLTGSPASVRDQESWMPALGDWTLEAAAARCPVLAVCFGHQLVGEALGGFVEPNPAGVETGTIQVALTKEGREDPLFRGLGSSFSAQSTHRDVLVRPPSATLLASTENTLWQAFGWGNYLRAVQFHPEIPPAALRDLCGVRGLPASVSDESDGPQILDNWIEGCL